jgi:glycerol dehydrogenase-like iron-containing ADH family enzyme
LSHAVDSLWPQNPYLHGIKVALFSIITLYLHNPSIDKEIKNCMLKFSDQANLFIEIENRIGIETLFYKALTIRTGRYTILNTIEIDQFRNAWEKTKDFFSKYTF